MKTAHEQTLRQRIEALRDDVESISLHNHIYGDGEGISASVVVARLTDALALPDGPEPGGGQQSGTCREVLVSNTVLAQSAAAILAESSPPFPKMAVRLTHAELAREMITSGCNPMGPRVISHLDTAAEIERVERVAREVCAEWDNINNPDERELGRAMDRLRALVQP